MIRPCLCASKNVDLYNFTGPCYLNSEWFPNWFFFDEMTTLRILLCVSISSAFNQLTGVFSFNKKTRGECLSGTFAEKVILSRGNKNYFHFQYFPSPKWHMSKFKFVKLDFPFNVEEGALQFFHKEWFVGFFGRFLLLKSFFLGWFMFLLC